MSCGRHRAESCPARLHLVGWATPGGAAHVVYHGYPRSYPTIPDVVAHEFECPLGDPSHGVTVADDVSERV